MWELGSLKESESHSVVSDFLWPHGLYSSWNFPGQNTGVDSYSLLQGIFPTQGSNPSLLHCQVDSLLTETPGKPKNTGGGSLSRLQKGLQEIFPVQELNWGLLRCRQILHKLSYKPPAFIVWFWWSLIRKVLFIFPSTNKRKKHLSKKETWVLI